MATYSAIRVTTTADTAVSAVSGGITTVTTEPAATDFDLVTVEIDDDNEIISGRAADGTRYVFESGAALTIALQA